MLKLILKLNYLDTKRSKKKSGQFANNTIILTVAVVLPNCLNY